MGEFNYKIPNEDGFLEALFAMLKAKGHPQLADLLVDSKCTIISSDVWSKISGELYTAHLTTVEFGVTASKYPGAVKVTDEGKNFIKKLSNELIKPEKSGLLVSDIAFSVKIEENKNLSKETYKSKKVVYQEITELARFQLFTLENALRYFVDNKVDELGGIIEDSFKRDWQSSQRKEFRPPRHPYGYPMIFYSTFDQLKRIIVQNENWERVFKLYFGRQDGVISRLNELDDIRDTLAHNRLISPFDYNSFKTLYDQIMGCIERAEFLG